MSPRLKTYRKVLSKPLVKGFRPFGPDLPPKTGEPVSILYEEYETIRLCDYQGLDQLKASAAMGISRPTLTRIYAEARRKIALAMVEGRKVIIEGGKVWFDSSWFACTHCSSVFSDPVQGGAIAECPLCGSSNIMHYEAALAEDSESRRCDEKCLCPACGSVQDKELGIPCRNTVCTNCGTPMTKMKPGTNSC